MTHVRQMHPQSVNSPSQIAEVPLSVLAQMLKDRERREQMAARIRQLWEESGHTEPEIADAIGLSLRGYQKAKQTGGISREPLEKLAEFHGVTPDWILTGRERGQTPDLGATMDNGVASQAQLDRIEKELAEVHALLAEFTDAWATQALPAIDALRAEAAARKQPSRATPRTGRAKARRAQP